MATTPPSPLRMPPSALLAIRPGPPKPSQRAVPLTSAVTQAPASTPSTSATAAASSRPTATCRYSQLSATGLMKLSDVSGRSSNGSTSMWALIHQPATTVAPTSSAPTHCSGA